MDLFAGIGGASYAGKLIGNWRTVCIVEWDKYCQQVIRQRQRDGIFDDCPIWGDIQTFDGKPWAGSVDIVTGGFPCQPFSVAGQRQGESDERNMWPETLRVIDEVRPRFAFLENVPGLITSGYFGRILGDLTEIGYDCRWTIVSAADVGAPHERKRLWILAYPNQHGTVRDQSTDGEGCGIKQGSEAPNPDNDESGTIRWWDIDPANISDTVRQHDDRSGHGASEICGEQSGQTDLSGSIDGQFIPHVGRVAHGLPDRCNRLKGLGNAWVPAVAATAWDILTRGR